MTEIPRESLREAGWTVAVHNDYRQDGKTYTFWLFTHPSGRWVKGEGETDADAIANAAEAALDQPAEGEECKTCGGKGKIPQASLTPQHAWRGCPDCNPELSDITGKLISPTPPEGELMSLDDIAYLERFERILDRAVSDRDPAPSITGLVSTARAAHTYKERCDVFLRSAEMLRQDLSERDDRITALEAELVEVRRNHRGAQDWSAELQNKCDSLQAQVKELEGERRATFNHAGNLYDENTRLQAQLTKAQNALRLYAEAWGTTECMDDQGHRARTTLDQMKEVSDA